MFKVLFLDPVHPILQTKLQEFGFECVLRKNSSYQNLAKTISLYDGIIIRSRVKLDKDILSKGENLKFIARAGSGMENIDVLYAESRQIKCINAPEGNRNSVAEHLLGMLLSMLNNLQKVDREIKQGIWRREENMGVELSGKTIAIIGFGNTGSAFANILKGFDVNILAFDKYKFDFGNEYVKKASLEEIHEKADFVSLHIPLTDETYYYADERFFNSFKKPVYFLNTSRGKVTQTSSLVKAIKVGDVLGACLDVLEYEKSSFESLDNFPEDFKYLINSNKVILSPHIAGKSYQSEIKIAKILLDKIKGNFRK